MNRFWGKVQQGDDCWLWTAFRNARGYGQFWNGERLVYAHRWAWHVTHGPVPPGLCVLHRCDTPSCVRPDHLWLGSLSDNAADMWSKDRGPSAGCKNRAKTHCPRGHEYSDENTLSYPHGRRCRACARDRDRGRKR